MNRLYISESVFALSKWIVQDPSTDQCFVQDAGVNLGYRAESQVIRFKEEEKK